MECLEEIVVGKAISLDVPVDKVKEFIEIFNSELLDKYSKEDIEADINDLTRLNDETINLSWKAKNTTGQLTFNILNNGFSLSIK